MPHILIKGGPSGRDIDVCTSDGKPIRGVKAITWTIEAPGDQAIAHLTVAAKVDVNLLLGQIENEPIPIKEDGLELGMRLPDGPGWSPDGGRYWVRDNILYWWFGGVWDMIKEPGDIRVMPGGYKHEEDYSQWTDEQRQAALEKRKKNLE